MKLRGDNLWCSVEEASPVEMAALLRFFERRTPPPTRGGGTQPDRHLFDGRKFPAGLLPDLLTVFEDDGSAQDVSEQAQGVLRLRSPADWPAPPRSNAPLPWLRPYQLEALEAWLRAGRGILSLPTGSGKTDLLAAACLEVKLPWLVLVPLRGLVGQTLARLKRRGVQDAGPTEAGDQIRVAVATYQSLAMGLEAHRPWAKSALLRAEALAVDECHRFAAQGAFRVVMAAENAAFRLGLSATPTEREDRLDAFTIGALGPVVYRCDAQSLVQQGYLSKGSVQFEACRHRDAAYYRGDWVDFYRRFIVESPARNAHLVRRIRAAERPTLVLVRSLEHGWVLLEELQRGTPALGVHFVHGDAPDRVREAAAELLRSSKLDVLIASTIFETGVDLPEIRTVVVAGAGKSQIASIQRLGRAMRRADGKTQFALLDVADLGHPWLERHTRRRVEAYRQVGYRVEGLVAELDATEGSAAATTLDGRVAMAPGAPGGSATSRSTPDEQHVPPPPSRWLPSRMQIAVLLVGLTIHACARIFSN